MGDEDTPGFSKRMGEMFPDVHEGSGTPAAGTRVVLLSQDDGRPYAATVQTWMSTASLVVTTRVAAGADAVRQLADHRVWMSVPESDRGFTVFSGVAQPAGATSLDLTGVAVLLRETQRETVRAPAATTVTVSTQRRGPRQLRGVDLARGGVRVALTNPRDLVLGEQVNVDVHLEDGGSFPASGQVTRLDEQLGQAVVRFDELPSDHGARIDRYVLLELTHS